MTDSSINTAKTQLRGAYSESIHFVGRIWTGLAILILITIPAAFCIYYQVIPDGGAIAQGLLSVAVIYLPIGAIEAITFGPILGGGASYLAFITGNLTNLKIPCAINALEQAHVESGSEEADILSTLSVAASSLTTNIIIILGVLLLIPLTPILQSPVLAPAFANVIPALFGALGYMFISRNWKLAVLPLIFIIVLFILLPVSIASSISGGLIPVTVLITIAGARFLYKKKLV
ncbi:MAG: hypothetical protein PWP10_4330 [Clostridiales bacterium]|jgi:hypothetical protein|nr:hypothetical protein [Eubacteriales bacterium]MDD3503490.1 hypothetical protein [Eubacteriales bacterium]MDD4682995.1 hypothetical protein [Eubacteriales bacterium]MDN5315578.1 hypothetical protein [Clostridiales bacterium]